MPLTTASSDFLRETKGRRKGDELGDVGEEAGGVAAVERESERGGLASSDKRARAFSPFGVLLHELKLFISLTFVVKHFSFFADFLPLLLDLAPVGD